MKNNLNPDEVTMIQMALATLIEDMEAVSKDVTIPFTPEARIYNKQILKAAKSALGKIQQASGHEVKLDPFVEGDQDEFLTKQS
jgi:hypothetical protein